MIVEESNTAILSQPVPAPRGLGWQSLIVDGTPDSNQRATYVADALSRTPPSIQALEAWSDRSGRLRSQVGKSIRPIFLSAYPSSAATREALARVGADGLGSVASSFGGLYTGDARMYLVNLDAPTISHEYGHFIDQQIGRIQSGYPAWTGVENDRVTRRNSWADAIAECYVGIEANDDTRAYGYKNYSEWFAEMYAAQLHPTYTGGASGAFAALFPVLCGRNLELAGHVRGLFRELIPDLPAFPWRNENGDVQRLLPCISGKRIAAMRTGTPFSATFEKEVAEAVTWSVSAGALPAGISHNGGTVSGTPTTPGSFDFTLTVSNANGSMTRRFQGPIYDSTVSPPVITTAATLPRAFSGETYAPTLQATGVGVTWSLVRSSAPVAVSSSGVVSITNTSTFTGGKFTARAANAGGAVDLEFEIPYSVRARWFSTALPALQANKAPSPTPTLSSQGSWPVSIELTAGSPPAGMFLDIQTPGYDAYVRGVPTTAGAYSFELTVTNEWGTAKRTFSGTVAA